MKTEPGKEMEGVAAAIRKSIAKEACGPVPGWDLPIVVSDLSPALFQLRNLLNGPAEQGRMDKAKRLCVLAIEERAKDHKEIERFSRKSLGGRIKGFCRLFTRGG